MKIQELRSLIKEEVKNLISESVTEPTPQQWKPVLDRFKAATGISIPVNTVVLRGGRPNSAQLIFDVDLGSSIKGAVMQTLFSTLNLEIFVYDRHRGIGSYGYTFVMVWSNPGLPDSRLTRYELGTIGVNIDGKIVGTQGQLSSQRHA